MKIELHRQSPGIRATLGQLYLDGILECLTLEDVVRQDPNPLTPENEAKVYGATAIPAGEYKVIIDFSQRFNKDMLHVLDVPGFTGIRIHSGNTDHDTLGCILVGSEKINDDFIRGGSLVLPILQGKIEAALAQGESATLVITDDFKS